MKHPYFAKEVLIATMHKKELVIQDIFEKKIGCNIILPENFNTDVFGTFSGEITRKYSAYETLKLKAIKASEYFNKDYVISSEGSFGPHPYFFFTADTEMLLFYDRIKQLFIAEYEISMDTNFAEFKINKDNFKNDEYYKWLDHVKFPSHGLILKIDNSQIFKGITSHFELEKLISSSLNKTEAMRLETDMRAMMNPTRMNVIKALTEKLSNRVLQVCDVCGSPGFGEVKYSGNLECEMCHQKTKTPKYKDFCCIKCDYKIINLIDSSKEFSDPTYCEFCNP